MQVTKQAHDGKQEATKRLYETVYNDLYNGVYLQKYVVA
jgi:hypothetical protein